MVDGKVASQLGVLLSVHPTVGGGATSTGAWDS